MALYTLSSLIPDERRKGKRPSDHGPWIKAGTVEEAPQSALYYPQVCEGTLENTSIKYRVQVEEMAHLTQRRRFQIT